MADSANERILTSATRHQIRLQSLDNSIVARIVEILDESALDIVARLQNLDPLEDDFARLEQMLAEIRAINATAYSRLQGQMNTELREFSIMEAEFQAGQLSAAINQGVVVTLAVYAPSPEQVIAAARAEPFQGRLLSEWYDSLSASESQRISDAVRIGYVQGENLQSIVGRVRGTRAKNFQDGAIAISKRNAEAVIRTALGHYAAKAQDLTIQANKHVIREIMWLSTLDGRTTRDICIPRSGKRYTLDHEPIGHSLPWLGGPGNAHFQCRSYALPVTKRFDEMGLDIPEPVPGTQPYTAFRPVEVNGQPVQLPKPAAKMSVKEYSDALRRAGVRGSEIRDIERRFIGRVPGTTTYGQFLKNQPASFQDEVLGPVRGRLFRRGQLKVESFVNDRGRFLTIDELNEVRRESQRHSSEPD